MGKIKIGVAGYGNMQSTCEEGTAATNKYLNIGRFCTKIPTGGEG